MTEKPTYRKLNSDYDAEPNAPNPSISINGNRLNLTFLLNPFLFDNVKDDEEAELIFQDVHLYRIGSPGSDNFRDYRYYNPKIDNYGFYQIENSYWKTDFPDDGKMVSEIDLNNNELKHFVFFFRDTTFECVAKKFEFIRTDLT